MPNLLHRFLSSSVKPDKDQKYLLAVSGGIDSMVMLHLFMEWGMQNFGVAHCNFNLRGPESNEDQYFIDDFTREHSIPFYSESFDTNNYAEKNHVSIQMAARDLRYEWFFKLKKQYNYNKIALAHNLDDNVETFFINLIRGTGLKGITGMKEDRGEIIRPLLQITRKDIEKYATENHIQYREDSSNKSTKYLRNKIRHDVLPKLRDTEKGFLEIMQGNMYRFEKAFEVYKSFIDSQVKQIVTHENNITKIHIYQLQQIENFETILFEILAPYRFSNTVINNIISSLDHQPGLRFYSNTHQCIKDRVYLLISKKENQKHHKYYIEESVRNLSVPLKLNVEIIEKHEAYRIEKNRNIAQLDMDKLNFPLILRKWEKGDYFMPLGMNAFKKLSDFFINIKISLLEKENIWLLTSGEKIVWIIGYRIDERFKIDHQTKNIFRISKI